jgi:hypothetical protein
MKKLILTMATTALLVVGVEAQNSPTNSPAGSFFNSFAAYFTSFTTNGTWTNLTLEVATGYKQVTGVNAASTLDLQYDIPNSAVTIPTSFQFSGVGSAINAAEVGVGYGIIEYMDTKVEVDLLAGWDGNTQGAVIEPLIALKKKMTANTFSELGISLPIYSNGAFTQTPTIRAEVGFTF